MQSIVWTAIPKCVKMVEGHLYLDLHVAVSPKLSQSADSLTGSEFANWAAKDFKFNVIFGSNPPVEATLVEPLPVPELWQAVFKNVYVKGFAFDNDLANIKILSYPVASISDYLKKKFKLMAAEPKLIGKKPGLSYLQKTFDKVVTLPQKTPDIFSHITSLLEQQGLVPENKLLTVNKASLNTTAVNHNFDQTELDLVQFKMFHEYKKSTVQPGASLNVQNQRPEFHEIISILYQYPEICKRLGLILTIRVPYNTNIPQQSRLQVVRKNPANGDQNPWTRYTLNVGTGTGSFLAAARPNKPEISGGMLILKDATSPDKDPYYLEQIDVDGLTKKVDNVLAIPTTVKPKQIQAQTGNMAAMAQPVSTTGVVVTNNAGNYVDALLKEDDGTPAMRSAGISLVKKNRAQFLMNRINNALSINNNLQTGTAELYAEDLVRGYRVDVWDSQTGNWHSLCKRLGNYTFEGVPTDKQIAELEDEGIIMTGGTKHVENEAGPQNTSKTFLHLHQSMFRWDGWSLCVSRPGKPIAETGLSVQLPPKIGFKTEFRVPDNSLPRLRFNRTYRLRVRVVDLAGYSVPTVPGQGDLSQVTVSRPINYGRFEPIGSPSLVLRTPLQKGESIERLVIRSNYNIPLPQASVSTERHIAPPQIAQIFGENHGMFDAMWGPQAYAIIKQREGSFNSVSRENKVNNASQMATNFTCAPGVQLPHPEAKLEVSFLPDPAASGAAFWGLPGKSGTELFYFGGDSDWRQASSFRIRVEGIEANKTPAPPQKIVNSSERVLKVQLAKAEIRTVEVSSYTNKHQQMGVWHWVQENNAANKNLILQQINTGRHWMVEPPRKIVLVHAVQQPLVAPNLQQFDITKGSIGDTFGLMQLPKMEICGKSTAKIDVWAEWEEYVDNPLKDTWEKIPVRAHVLEVPVQRNQAVVKFANKKHEFGDTKFRNVRYQAEATSSFREYFPEGTDVKRSGLWYGHSVQNSARPDAPNILYAIPAFGWDEWKTGTNKIDRRRRGGCLRVYMDRPWYSSGEGELLAVVIRHEQEPVQGQKDPLKPYVTDLGMDPIWKSNPTYDHLTVGMFPRRWTKPHVQTCSLDEVPNRYVDVVPHEVFWDSKRKLWYCDIEVIPGPCYYPFIRLALARYQPQSLNGAHLSRVVQAEFAQLAPERTATVVFTGAKTASVKLVGNTYTHSCVGPGGSHVEVVVETRSESSDDEMAWVPACDPLSLQYYGAGYMWQGNITLPYNRGVKPMRLIFKEYESFKADGASPSDQTIIRRLVYADEFYI